MTVPLNWRGKLFALMFTSFALMITYGIVFLFTNTITFEDGDEVGVGFKLLIGIPGTVVDGGLFWLSFQMLPRLSRKRGCATLTPLGIEDTFVIFTILAFWTVLPVRVIPWEAVRFYMVTDRTVSLSLDMKRVPRAGTGALARLILRLAGYPFLFARINREEFEAYLNAVRVSVPVIE